MSGPYAHMTLVHFSKPPAQAMQAYNKYLRYVELGSISPDYPTFSLLSGTSFWADAMHSFPPRRMGQAAREKLKDMSGPKKDKCLAWLLGYMAHIATDLTIHPAITHTLGAHSICEINQDAWAFHRLKVGEIRDARPLQQMDKCFSRKKGYKLDTDIEVFWTYLLEHVYPTEWAKLEPDFSKWHASFKAIVDSILSGDLVLFGRHIKGAPCAYPDFKDLNKTYINDLDVPSPPGGSQHYDLIFDRAIESTEKLWADVVSAVFEDIDLPSGVWALDTGMDLANKMVFWV